MTERKAAVFDWARIAMALLVVANHTSPLASVDATADFVLTRVVARVAVPLFFMLTGYFVVGGANDSKKISAFLKKTALLYGISILLYLPLNIYTGYFSQENLPQTLLRDVVFAGTTYHLWYFPAVLLGVGIVFLLKKRLPKAVCGALFAALYLIGLLGDSYYGFIPAPGKINDIYQLIFNIFGYTRNGLFFAPLFIWLGSHFRGKKPMSVLMSSIGLGASLLLMTVEGLLLRSLDVQRHDSMYALLPVVMIFLFGLLARFNTGDNPQIRRIATYIYVLHPWAIVGVRGIAKYTRTTALLVENSLVFYLCVAASTVIVSILISAAIERLKPKPPDPTARAWAEIDLDNLTHNVHAIQSHLPKKTQFMAVVKANAYGHGDIEVSRHLNRIGVRNFAVATLEEAIQLRKHRVSGAILILGYTDPRYARLLKKYLLTQTVCDFSHATALNTQRVKLNVHLKLDTGMHRLGVDAENTETIARLFAMKHLRVTGVYSHLSAADSVETTATKQCARQLERFGAAVANMRSRGLDPGLLHLQNSYGAANYTQLGFDFARLGILMYGADSDKFSNAAARLALKPALALRARVASVRRVAAGECVGYGTNCQLQSDKRLAALTIGYADGLPRNFAAPGSYVLINGQRTPIIGRICMDQMIVDVTDIANVKSGDIATIIGQSGDEFISCECVAAQCDTITNELLSRLGARLGRVYIKR